MKMHIFFQELWNNHKDRPYPEIFFKKTETKIEIIAVENRKKYLNHWKLKQTLLSNLCAKKKFKSKNGKYIE